MDDTTLPEIIPKGTDSNMDCLLNEVVKWSCDNLMNINWYKTKEMVLGAKSAFNSDLCVNDNVVERVHVFKLLDDNLKWDSHVDTVCAKASIRLHFLTRKLCYSKDDRAMRAI